MGGILPLILIVNEICFKYDITEGKVESGCDSISALRREFGFGPVPSLWPSYDIMRIIRHHLQRSSIKWKWRHVKGHQDDKKKYEDLDCWGKATTRVDTLAKHNMQKHPKQLTMDSKLPGSGWTIEINGEPLTSNVSKELYYHCTHKAVKLHWARRSGIDIDVFPHKHIYEDINWEAIQKMTSMMPSHIRRWITKHMSGNSATKPRYGTREEKGTPNKSLPYL